ncbi:YraN family protein [Amycolatopsis sp. H20-H5]|uniref:YraN family protein n=1 Tax=Amycolatopsis sp. H20-H5 TaxID=3046309 RepID=UPI002DBD0CE4|nr:YraN family protein [Amycolatopsis sp. H20-H5]MEC3980308.1 YraN family protein [Amycolatopsis sp. H20-H5]
MMGTVERPAGDARAAWRVELGRRGEELAARHLENTGLVVLSRNWRSRAGELDLVLTDGRTLVVCEVKTRSGVEYGLPAEAVTPEKRERIRRLAQQWLRDHEVGWCPVRYDVVAVLAPRGQNPSLKHIKGAF